MRLLLNVRDFPSVIGENLQQLETQGANILAHLNDVIFCDAVIVTATLLGGHIASHKQLHHFVMQLLRLLH